jgi:cytochrome c oxidase subunit 4
MAADTLAAANHHEHPKPNYMAVFYALFGLTVMEVGVTYMGLVEWMMIVILLIMAFVKAIMVAAYFMHLRYDNIVLTIIAGVPLVLACIALSVVAYEYTHYMPALPAPFK